MTGLAGAGGSIVGVSACHRRFDNLPHHVVYGKYLDAVCDAGATPLIVPALGVSASGGRLDADALLDRLDGLVLTGSPTMVDPGRYGGAELPPDCYIDLERDATTIPLAAAAVSAGLPLLAICRGVQELNCAFGGTLQASCSGAGGLDHSAPKSRSRDARYATRHGLEIMPGGRLAQLATDAHLGLSSTAVNSLHRQSIEQVGAGLRVEARAPDGGVEAVSVDGARAFALGIQWHPEWRNTENGLDDLVWAAFGAACQARAAARRSRLC